MTMAFQHHTAAKTLQFQLGLLHLAEAVASRAAPPDAARTTIQAMSLAATELDYLAAQARAVGPSADLTP